MMMPITQQKRSSGRTRNPKKGDGRASELECKQLELRLGELAMRAMQARAALRSGTLKLGGQAIGNPELNRCVTELVGDYHAMVGGVSKRLRSLGKILRELRDGKG
jgi:hypothetical protein